VVDTPQHHRLRPLVVRIVTIAALCGAAVGLLQIGSPRSASPVPAFQDVVDDPLLMADTEFKFALFAKNLAAWAGVPGRMSPTVWEERAVAHYERLALASPPAPAACHRLAVIYAKRGYRQQAQTMLMRALAEDEIGAPVYIALASVYSDEPVPPKHVPRITQLLRQQPRWWALTTLAELGRRVDAPAIAKSYDRAALGELWRFGIALALVGGGLVLIVGLSIVALTVLGIRVLFSRYWAAGPTTIWAYGLPTCSWLDLLDVVALMLFCGALGQVIREALAAHLPADALLPAALRMAHYLLLGAPALILVVSRTGPRWSLALGLQSKSLGRNMLQGFVALGTALFAVLLVQDLLAASFRVMVPGLGSTQLGDGTGSWAGGSPASIVGQLVVVIVLAPLVEEMIFRG
jgi:hypothetical protein